MRVPLGVVTFTYLDTSVCPVASHVDASHMGPRFHRGTVGYDRDTLPNKSPATTRYPKLKGRGEFLEKVGEKPL